MVSTKYSKDQEMQNFCFPLYYQGEWALRDNNKIQYDRIGLKC